MFKKSLVTVSASALMLFCASQANAADLYEPAMPDLSAVISMYGGGASLDTRGHGISGSRPDGMNGNGYWLAGGDARVAGQSWQLEIDGSVLGHLGTSTDDDDYSNYLALGGHWLGRGETGTWGIFGSMAFVGHQDSADHSTHFFGGLEYAHFMGDSTLFGQLGGTVGVAGDTSDSWEQGIFGRLGWRYFWSESTKIEIDGMVGWGHFDSENHDGVTANWGAEFEHQFAKPFSGFVAYKGYYVEDSTSFVWDSRDDSQAVSHAFLVGFRIDVNSDTLMQRERSGAGTFDLPDLQRAYAWPDGLN